MSHHSLWRSLTILVPLVCALGCAKDPYLGMTPAQKISAQTLAAIGGAEALSSAKFIRYDVVEKHRANITSRRNHDWERAIDNYSVQWFDPTTEETYKVQFKPSRGYEDGTALTSGGRVIRNEEEREKVLEQAWDYYIKDKLWLLAPYSILASDTKVEYVGRVVDYRGAVSERFDIKFPEGRTPHAEYRVYADPNTHAWEMWEIPIEEDFSLYYTWEAWRHAGPLTVSLRHRQIDGDHSVAIEKLRVDAGQ